jgi:hypothetical protein
MMRNTSLKHLLSPKALRRTLRMVSGVIAWLGGAPGANAANCLAGVPSFQLEVLPSGIALVSICQTTPVATVGIGVLAVACGWRRASR